MPETLAEFWRMVWEEGVQTLVMLTNTQEKGKVGVAGDVVWVLSVGVVSVVHILAGEV